MKLKLIANIAVALLLARRKQTLVAATGVAFSIMMFVTLLGFMQGLNDLLDGIVLKRTAHVLLYNEVKPTEDQPIEMAMGEKDAYHFIRSIKPDAARKAIYNVGEIQQTLAGDRRVAGVAPKITVQVFYNVGDIEITGIINGVDVVAETRLYHFEEYVTSGDPMALLQTPSSIIMGKEAAGQILAGIGDMVQITTSTGEQQQLKVVGYLQSGLKEVDKVQSYTSLATAQKLIGKPRSYITDLQVKLHDLNIAPVVADEYRTLFDVDTEDIQTANAQFETGSSMRTLISYAVGITLLIVSGFGIYNILNMMIYEKMDSIAILKATGFSGRDVKRIFVFISLCIGIAGSLAGLLMGFLTSVIIDQIPFNTPALPRIKTYPVNYAPAFYIIATLFGLATTYLAGWLPSRKAAHIDPVIIIRGK